MGKNLRKLKIGFVNLLMLGNFEKEAEEIGFKIMLCANTALRSAIKGIRDSLQQLKEEGTQENLSNLICTWEERQSLFKLHQIKEWEQQYSHN